MERKGPQIAQIFRGRINGAERPLGLGHSLFNIGYSASGATEV